MITEINCSKNIKSARIKAGFKQTDMARMMGVCLQTYNRFETRPFGVPISRLVEIANLLSVEPNLFFCEKTPQNVEQ